LAVLRITDATGTDDPLATLRSRVAGYAQGDTDLAWSRITYWRALLASALDQPPYEPVTSAVVSGLAGEPALDILAGFDVILDASDNFPTRYLVDDACRLLGKPLIYGSVFRFEGQMSVFHWPVNGVCTGYRDLFPEPPQPGEAADCNEAGVLGVLPGIIGTMQAAEAIKLIAGLGTPMANRLYCYQLLTHSTYTLDLVPRTDAISQAPESAEAFKEMNYDWFCNVQMAEYQDIDGPTFDRIRAEISPQVLDVRNLHEWPKVTEFEHLRIPLSELEQNLHLIDPERPLVVFCQSGVRSVTALHLITERLPIRTVYHLKGGILKWKTQQ
jgi:adenylyltransferase/sulfurtransferase